MNVKIMKYQYDRLQGATEEQVDSFKIFKKLIKASEIGE